MDINSKEYDDYLKQIEEEADNFLSVEAEFEDIDDSERSFRFEYAFESLTTKGSRFRKNMAY